MSEDCAAPTEDSLTDSEFTHSGSLQTDTSAGDERASLTLYALVVVGLLVVGLVAAFVMFGGVLNGDSPAGDVNDTEPAGDTDPTPTDDGSDDNNSSDPVETPDDDDGDENTTDGTDSDDSDSDSDDDDSDSDSSDDQTGGDENETEEPEYATLVGSVEVLDLGVTDEGAVGVYSQETSSLVELYDLSNATNFIIEDLPPDKTYTVKVTPDQAPPKEVTITPEPGETITRQLEVGHKLRGADTFVEEWHIELENEGLTYSDGLTLRDKQGNMRWSWNDPPSPDRYNNLYIAEDNSSYTTFGKGEWERSNQYFGPGTFATSTKMVVNSISGVDEREFIKETTQESVNNTVYQYYIPEGTDTFENSNSFIVNVNPQTGYITYIKLDQSEGLDVGRYKNHDENVTAVPEDFPY